jgi:hypothetical protein
MSKVILLFDTTFECLYSRAGFSLSTSLKSWVFVVLQLSNHTPVKASVSARPSRLHRMLARRTKRRTQSACVAVIPMLLLRRRIKGVIKWAVRRCNRMFTSSVALAWRASRPSSLLLVKSVERLANHMVFVPIDRRHSHDSLRSWYLSKGRIFTSRLVGRRHFARGMILICSSA